MINKVFVSLDMWKESIYFSTSFCPCLTRFIVNVFFQVLRNSGVFVNDFTFNFPFSNVTIVLFSSCQSEDTPEQQEDVTSGKKKRRKKKKKATSEDFEAELEEPASYQEPPKIEVTWSSAFISHSVTPKTFCSVRKAKRDLIVDWN